VQQVLDSGLRGRGGAAFPAGIKWRTVAQAQSTQKYVVCNADEGDSGTFADRMLLEGDPYLLIEGMAIAALAVGASKGFVYIRSEYPHAIETFEAAIRAARQAGVLGARLLGTGPAFDIEARVGGGSYVCGEETAMLESLEGKRGIVRAKPPLPAISGLFGKPTVENNVETLINVLDIVIDGGAAYATTGTRDSTGMRLFCVSGHVLKPGLYEVPMGTSLRALIELAEGLGPGRTLQAVLLGGAAGSFVTPAQLDVPLSFEGTRAIGATLGSGAVIVFDDTADMKQMLLRIARFFRDESCGQCVPCRVGTKRQEEILERLLAAPHGDRRADVMLLTDIAQAMRDASICGLGQTAANAIGSGLSQLRVLNG